MSKHTPVPGIPSVCTECGSTSFTLQFENGHVDSATCNDCKYYQQVHSPLSAALIAAAPTMLEQLRESARLMCYYRPRDKYPDGSVIQGPSETLRNLCATIALAEGRDPGEGVTDAGAMLAKAEGRS